MKKFIPSLIFLLSFFIVKAQDYTPAHNKGVKIKTEIATASDSLIAIQSNGKIVRSTKTTADIAENLSDLTDDIGATDPIVPNTIFVNTITGNDLLGVPENRNKPVKTLAEAYNRLPNDGSVWDINFVDGNVTRDMSAPMPSIAFNIISDSQGIFDFSGLSGSEGATNGNKTFYFPNAKMIFGGDPKFFGSANGFLKLTANEVEITCSTPNTNFGFFSASSTTTLSFININKLTVNSYVILCGYTGDFSINENFNFLYMHSFIGNGATINNAYFKKITLPTSETPISFLANGKVPLNLKINEISGDSEFLLGSVILSPLTLDLDGLKLTNLARISLLDRFRSQLKVIGNAQDATIKVLGSTNSPGTSLLYKVTFDNFIGKLEAVEYQLYAYEFINCSIIFDNYLLYPYTTNFKPIPKGIIFRGINSLYSLNDYEQLIVNCDRSTNIYDYGYITTNVKTFGKNINVIKPNSTFKEKLNEQIIRSKVDLVNQTLSTDITYIIDGTINLAANDSIIVPPGGNLTINGYGLEASSITKDVPGEAIFYSRASGSGGLLMDGLKIVSGAGSVFELTDETGFNAVEFVKVNFEGCASLGELNGYRQSLWTNIGLFGNSDGITFEGNWIGGFRSENVIVRNMVGATGTLFKKGASLTFASRFYSNANIDLPTGWKLADFEEANFTKNDLFQLQNMIITRNGISDDTDSLYVPNIDQESTKSKWAGNTGLKNSSLPFTKLKSPDGTVYKITVNDAGTIVTTEL